MAYLSLIARGLLHPQIKDFATLAQDLSISVLQTKDFSTLDQDLFGLVHVCPQQALRHGCKRIISYSFP